MKLLLILLIPFVLNAWTVSKSFITNMSLDQKRVLRASYAVGQASGLNLGISLQAIAIVENLARMKDYNGNHICGPHQVDIRYAKASCKRLETEPYYSAELALANLKGWRTRTTIKNGRKIKTKRSWYNAYRMYNVGYTNHPHGPVYAKRVLRVMKVLKELKKEQNEKNIYLWLVKG